MKNKPNSKEIFRLFWKTSEPYKHRRNLAIFFAMLTLVVTIFVGPLIIAQLLSIVQHNQLHDAKNLWTLIALYGVSELWSSVIGWRLVLYLVWTFETAMQRDLYARCFSKLTNQTLFFHSNKFGGSLVSQTNKLVGAVESFWDTIIWSVLPLVISLVGSIIVLSTLLWQYALFLLIFSIVFSIVVYYGSKPMAKLTKKEAKSSNKLNGQLADVISNVLAVKSSGAEATEQKFFTKTVNSWRDSSLDVMRGFLKVSTIYSSINMVIKIGAIAFAVYAAQNNLVSVASVYLIITYTGSVAHELWNMNGIMRNYNRIIGNANDMVEILQTPTTLIDKSDSKLKVTNGEISMDKIIFTHDEGQGDTLFHDFSLEIKPGEKIGLVGASGSGKTTLTKLLLRFADIDSGKITIDGQDISEVTQASLRAKIAYVPQEPLLFHRSVRENIAYGRPDATDAEIEEAAKKAGAYDFIVGLKDGFDTMVGERGIKLSGGQRQRVAIARAILKDAPILVLDEATSALDSESEALIQKSLETLMENRTSIVIAHRLSTIAKLDRIIVLKDGKIVEDGSHDELINKKRGVYAKLWARQSGGFIEE
ncbi:ABC transporter ATP-binding protein/permease [Candidatus Nanosynbacter sp. HMT-352]|uniref:ABC transporter ATP-binding protein n=1 Tax=Candidatus Nanosynbacter sp. HMT-352 TaxID=2899133 RepID=UPI001FB6807F|nr:ABC transporter ATP-binding protein [Candidatus Nanosynbacter sp. HMT-352]UOG66336.1 ABC transporter ATP-binding protein/permease [Candidatus Nanosynbacter sp. HMT-352]